LENAQVGGALKGVGFEIQNSGGEIYERVPRSKSTKDFYQRPKVFTAILKLLFSHLRQFRINLLTEIFNPIM
jgi:hypothetical protein